MRHGIVLFLAFNLVACGDDDTGGSPDASPPATNGEACMSDSDCESGLCLLEFGAVGEPGHIEFVDGMCTTECNDDFTGCEEDQICLKHNASGQFHCYPRCDVGTDCRDSYVCLDFTPYDVTDHEAACIPESAI